VCAGNATGSGGLVAQAKNQLNVQIAKTASGNNKGNIMNEKQRDYHRNYYRVYREQSSTWKTYKQDYNKEYLQRIRETIFKHYGMSCATCGKMDFSQLSIDHINNDGGKHRREIGMKCGGYNFYLWLIKNNFPEGYQTLCISCNSRKNALWMKENHIGFFAHPRKSAKIKPKANAKPKIKIKPIQFQKLTRCVFCNRKLINNLCLCGRKQVQPKPTHRIYTVDELLGYPSEATP